MKKLLKDVSLNSLVVWSGILARVSSKWEQVCELSTPLAKFTVASSESADVLVEGPNVQAMIELYIHPSRVIKQTRVLTDEELAGIGWEKKPGCEVVSIQLANGILVLPSQDPQGTQSGMLLTLFGEAIDFLVPDIVTV